MEGITEMFLSECQQAVIAFDQIGRHDIAVIVAVGIKHAEQRIRFVLRQHGHDQLIRAEQQDGGERDALPSRVMLRKHESRAADKLFVHHAHPRMIVRAHARHPARTIEQIRTEIPYAKDREDFIHIVTAAFPRIEPEHLIRMMCDVDVGVMIPIKNPPAASADLLRARHADIEEAFPVCFVFHRCEIERRVHFILVVDGRYKVFLHPIDSIRRDADDLAAIVHAEKYMSAAAVGKSAHGLVHILRDVRLRFLKFDGDAFTAAYEVHELLRHSIHCNNHLIVFHHLLIILS